MEFKIDSTKELDFVRVITEDDAHFFEIRRDGRAISRWGDLLNAIDAWDEIAHGIRAEE